MSTTRDRVRDLRRQFDELVAEDPSRVDRERVGLLIAANAKLPHSADQHQLEDDLLDFLYLVSNLPKIGEDADSLS